MDGNIVEERKGTRWVFQAVMLSAAVVLATACAPAAPPPAASSPTVAAQPPAAAAQPTAGAAKPAQQAGSTQSGFYAGKTVRLIVGVAAGGGYDTYARAIARHLGRFLPGTPSVIVENMEGAGGLIAANHVYKVAPQDGTVVHSFIGGLAVQELLGQRQTEFQASNFQWLGAPTPDTFACVVKREAGISSFAEWKASGKQLVFGGIAPGGSVDDVAKVVRAAYGLPMKIVSGYSGTSKVRLAMDAGEVDGVCYSYESWKATSAEQIASGAYRVLGIAAEKRLEDLPQVPTFGELATTDEARALIANGILARSRTERAYLMGPGVPQERVMEMRQAFAATLKDPAFLEDAAKAKLDVNPVPAEEVEKRMKDLFAMPPALKATLKDILTKE